jgi:hypothetical protein
MPAKQNDVFEHLEALFKNLDAAKLAPETILKSEAQKEHYEAYVMFAFRKLQAARYHCERVEALVATQHHELCELHAGAEPEADTLKITSTTMRISKSAQEFACELSAFFAAIRSAIDFLAIACAQHLDGVEATSIKTLLRLAKSKTGPILDVIAEDTEWIARVRDYRDHLVHRLVIPTTSGGETHWKYGNRVTVPYPIVVPAEMPRHIPDTRRARALDDPEARFMVSTSETLFTSSNPRQHFGEHTVEIEPAPGYIRIEDLMGRELAACERFFVRIIDTLIKLNFAPVPLKASLRKEPQA